MSDLSTRLVERASSLLAPRISRRGLLTRTAIGGSALVASPARFVLEPVTAYAAICSCNGSSCACGSLCCDGYTEFCCTISGENKCPPGTQLGGWWKVEGTSFCNGARYYMDCNAPCNGCGCGANGICSGSCSGTGCGCTGGSCDNRKSGCTQFRYGQCNQGVACMGPIVCRLVTCVPPWAIDATCTGTVRVDLATASHDRGCLHRVVGSVEAVTVEGSKVRVQGWALDFDVADPLTVTVQVQGGPGTEGTANGSRPDIAAAYPGWGAQHGFDLTLDVPGGGTRTVEVVARNRSYGDDVLLATRQVTLAGATPFGALELVADAGGALRVAGWAIDADTSAPLDVHVYVDGAPVRTIRADLPRSDVAAAHPEAGSNHGFDATLTGIAPGPHDVCVYAIGVGSGGNAELGCRKVTLAGATPFGALELVAGEGNAVRVVGWAIDADTTDPLDVHVYVDGAPVRSIRANVPRPDVAAAHPQAGPNHGFDATITGIAAGERRVCVYAIGVGSGGNVELGCRTVTVAERSPFGALDIAEGGSARMRVAGWAIDPDTYDPINVRIVLDGTPVRTVTANRSRPDVGSLFPAWGANHGYDLEVTNLAPGLRRVCVTAVDVGPGTDRTFPCATVRITGVRGFLDVPFDSPFADDIAWAVDTGVALGYGDDTFRPTLVVRRQELSAFLRRLSGHLGGPTGTAAPGFSDVGASHPFRSDIGWMVANGIATGYPDGTYRPLAPVSRGEMAAFLRRSARALGAEAPDAAPPFSDVAASHPFAGAIGWLAQAGIALGDGSGRFRPSSSVTRQEMTAFLHNLAEALA